MKFSNSKIQCYKSCRRLYDLKYNKGMRYIGTTEALEIGKNYHETIGKALLQEEIIDSSNPKINAMARAFMCYVMPKLPSRVVELEKYFEYENGVDRIIHGYFDGVFADGTVIEHKTTSFDVDGEYQIALENDEQTMTYLTASQKNSMWYTVCKKPTIRQKQNETAEEFEERCFEWYGEETSHKITTFEVRRTDSQLFNFWTEQNQLTREIRDCNLFYKNPSNCTRFGRMCEYFPLCNNFDENAQYPNFEHINENGESDLQKTIENLI